ncbi:MAG: dephospho-CoA kinase, partial [Verrucomicrobiae bacterium]|nr:dephospho-CoA kinase [Verrucomicrobiae bacterium]
AAVVQQFGPGILNPDQTINRQRLGDLVFADEQKRLALNQIVHPVVRAMWTKRLEELSREGRAQTVVAVIPLLFEVGAENEFDYVVTVGCSEGVQRARLQARGLSPERAEARILSQWPLKVKLDRADFVIWNDGALAVTEKQAAMIWQRVQN